MRLAPFERASVVVAALIALATSACGDDPESIIDVVVSEVEPGLPERLDELRLSASVVDEDGEEVVREETAAATYGARLLLPWANRLRPRAETDVGRVLYEIRATGWRGGEEYVASQARLVFVPGGRVVLPLRFEAACVGTSCGDARTCRAGVCVDDAVASCDLLTGARPTFCGGGRDSGSRDATGADAPPPDLGPGQRDMSVDDLGIDQGIDGPDMSVSDLGIDGPDMSVNDLGIDPPDMSVSDVGIDPPDMFVPPPPDSGPPDSGPPDSGPLDSGPPDSGRRDMGAPDTGIADSGPADMGSPDMGDPTLLPCADVNIGSALGVVFMGSLMGRGDDVSLDCVTAGEGSPDLVLQWVAPSTGRFVFHTCGPGFFQDTAIQVIRGTCTSRVVACNDDDDAFSCPINPLSSRVALDVMAGELLLITVDGDVLIGNPQLTIVAMD